MKVELKITDLTYKLLYQFQTLAPDTCLAPDSYKVIGWLFSKMGRYIVMHDESKTYYKVPWMGNIKCQGDAITYVNLLGVVKTRKFPSVNYRVEFVNRYSILQSRAVNAGQIYF